MKPGVALVFPTTISADSFFGFLLPSMALERLGAAIADISRPELFDARFEKDIVASVQRMNPDIIILNIKTTMYCQKAYSVARDLHRTIPDAIIIGGGLHATACPHEAMQFCHMVVRGEGETPLRMIVSGQNPSMIPSLVYRNADNEIIMNPMAQPIENLDTLRPPARYLRKAHYKYAAAGLIPMDLLETSRGCTHACSFCSPASVYPCRYRQHSPQYVFNEILTMANAGVKYCMLTDDHFGGDHERVEKICDLIIASGIRIAFFCFTRPFAGNMELKKKMVKAGFVMLSYGAESPSSEQLTRYGKGYPDNHRFLQRVNSEWLQAGACYIGNSYVFGDINDNAEVLAGLGDHARHLDSTYIEPLYSQPYPGTRYRQSLHDKGLLLDRGWSHFTEGTLLVHHPDLDEMNMAKMRARAWLHFFSPRKVAGVFRVPLHLNKILGIPVLTVLRYMRACDYSIFGCVLENRFYSHLHLPMIRHYFRNLLPIFEKSEMNMLCDGKFDEFTNMLGLLPLKRLAGNRRIVFKVVEGTKTLATLETAMRNGQIVSAQVTADSIAPEKGDITLPIPLWCLAMAIGANREFLKVTGWFLIIANALAMDLPRKLLLKATYFLSALSGRASVPVPEGPCRNAPDS
ncbi:MAG: hypothetical protein CVV64_10140 [Candidatus Wallbacteria bacterium HGW-Wallbacteria-1]|jgi:radical SAM superfamily enzyme YgiQ (UPF0313 family)|uniref:Uncharacterized protein n=1 Tax=Candidatus Wallbacteria bacterium HGW-Wallbacteria-1 TaxID=2013854 RepID=A0A2N1PPQ0_9BACT|nr:MAG: hypothetical protein CVV64_10140 [Candidatus Wallbacteria bacterium HGW-Wallbacteria-1]